MSSVGTYDLSTYLITAPQGHILINTGLPQTVKQISSDVEQLGFKVSDIRILTASKADGERTVTNSWR